MIRVEEDAVYLPAACLEHSTCAIDDNEGGGAAATEAASGRCHSCFPRGRRRAGAVPTRADDADADADACSLARLPLDRLVGAELDARGRVRVWFTALQSVSHLAKKELRGYVCPPPLQVRVSAPVDAGGGNGEALVSALRAGARRRGGGGRPPPRAPRVVAIVIPVSGRGKAARNFRREALPALERAAGLTVETLPDAPRGPRAGDRARP